MSSELISPRKRLIVPVTWASVNCHLTFPVFADFCWLSGFRIPKTPKPVDDHTTNSNEGYIWKVRFLGKHTWLLSCWSFCVLWWSLWVFWVARPQTLNFSVNLSVNLLMKLARRHGKVAEQPSTTVIDNLTSIDNILIILRHHHLLTTNQKPSLSERLLKFISDKRFLEMLVSNLK